MCNYTPSRRLAKVMATAGASRPDCIPSANDRAYALRVLGLDAADLDVRHVLGRQQRPELRRRDARHALAGGA